MHKVIITNLETTEKIVKDVYSATDAAEATLLTYSYEVDSKATPGIINPVPGTDNRFLIIGECMHSAIVAELKTD